MEYKALMYGGVFVASSKLYDGIYEAALPSLYPIDTTKNDLLERHKKFLGNLQTPGLETTGFTKNLKSCELVVVRIEVVSSKK